jgi:hypothetical protein
MPCGLADVAGSVGRLGELAAWQGLSTDATHEAETCAPGPASCVKLRFGESVNAEMLGGVLSGGTIQLRVADGTPDEAMVTEVLFATEPKPLEPPPPPPAPQ